MSPTSSNDETLNDLDNALRQAEATTHTDNVSGLLLSSPRYYQLLIAFRENRAAVSERIACDVFAMQIFEAGRLFGIQETLENQGLIQAALEDDDVDCRRVA